MVIIHEKYHNYKWLCGKYKYLFSIVNTIQKHTHDKLGITHFIVGYYT